MSKYIIELGEDANMVQVISVTQSGNAYIDSTVYVEYLEQLNSDYINEHFGDLQDTAYQKGFEDCKAVHDKGCEGCKWAGMTGQPPCIQCSNNYPNVWQKQDDKIEVGDEVIYNGTTKCLVVRPETDERYAVLIDSNGNHHHADHSECKKTGRHFDIGKILEEMRK